ncbi:hypothetical protein EVAR_32657_1 [Eumeta japonica]|uniref:Uncharacterized protein n=1 Tax=Eumeta variegata TaxID=151549 RepID=A0A4C1WTV6_EUMVA|nr:hypothetical protein EVAR_32657_1 [Eumeta japonica]
MFITRQLRASRNSVDKCASAGGDERPLSPPPSCIDNAGRRDIESGVIVVIIAIVPFGTDPVSADDDACPINRIAFVNICRGAARARRRSPLAASSIHSHCRETYCDAHWSGPPRPRAAGDRDCDPSIETTPLSGPPPAPFRE